MRVLTLHQPWASLIALGAKTIETRSWSTTYRGPLAIHAARHIARLGEAFDAWSALPRGTYEATRSTENRTRFPEDGQDQHPLPLGAVVATCTLADVVPIVHLGEETAVRRVEVGCAAGEPNLMLCAPDPTQVEDADGVLSLSYDAEAGVDFDASDFYERDVTDQLPYGDFTPGRFAWLLADVVPLDPPVPFKGGQGLSRSWSP